MKLRFHSNSLRLRLSQSDIARLAETGRVEETVAFGPGQMLAYSVETCSIEPGAAEQVSASFENGRIRVMLPGAHARRWIESDETGIENSSGGLRVLVEKDFQCIHPESEEDRDGFPNPLARTT